MLTTPTSTSAPAAPTRSRANRRRQRTRRVPRWQQDKQKAFIAKKEKELGKGLDELKRQQGKKGESFSEKEYAQSRQEALKANVRMLVDLLSSIVKQQEGEALLNLIEEVRILAKARRTDDLRAGDRINEIIHELMADVPRLFAIQKMFTLYFQLINIAEEQQRVRVLRHRARIAQEQGFPTEGNISFAMHWLYQEGMTQKEMENIVSSLSITPVFTAHPTEANRRTVLFKHKMISDILSELDIIDLGPDEKAARTNLIRENIHSLWQTDENREKQPTVLDEVRHGLHYLSTTVFDLIPHVYQELEKQIRRYYPKFAQSLPTFLRYGSWIGGDRDGNPFVTGEVTQRTLREQHRRLLELYLEDVKILFSHLSMSINHAKFTDDFLARLEHDISRLPNQELKHLEFIRREPYRQMLTIIRRKLTATLERAATMWDDHPDNPMVYSDSSEMVKDLEAVEASLRACQGEVLADGRLSRLITCLRVCGFHFATLDIRQHSERHTDALHEICARYSGSRMQWRELTEDAKLQWLAEEFATTRPLTSELDFSTETNETVSVFRVVRRAQERMGQRVVDSYIISMTERPSQILEVLLLAKDAALLGRLDIVPLFESIDDLERAPEILRVLFAVPYYQEHLRQRGQRQPIMIGYSDSNKDGGYLSATWSLFKAQQEILAVCDEFNITAELFHGRGGSVSRGGGDVSRSINTQPPDTIRGRIKVTEQGEVISTHYTQPTIARRHMEQLVGEVLLRSGPRQSGRQEAAWMTAMEELGRISNRAYRDFVEHPHLIRYFLETTPVEAISRLNIGSRPAKRRQTAGVQDLRAIPWVFSWSQCRVNLSNWYGVGSAIMEWTEQGAHAERVALLRTMVRDWNFFKTLIENVQSALWKTDLFMASQYATLTGAEARQIFDKIESEFHVTVKSVLLVLNQKSIGDEENWLYRSVQLRNPYVDPLSFIQIALMQQLRSETLGEEGRELLENGLNLSVKGLAAGLYGTG